MNIGDSVTYTTPGVVVDCDGDCAPGEVAFEVSDSAGTMLVIVPAESVTVND